MKIQTGIENLIFSTCRLKTELGVGTVFIVDHPKDEKQVYRFLVTNKHVVDGAKSGVFYFTQSMEEDKPQFGKILEYKIEFDGGWFFHNEMDVAILPFGPFQKKLEREGYKIFIRSIPTSLIPTKEQMEEFDALEEIIFIGYPNNIFDRKNLLPIIRRGITATPLSINYEGQSVFLIDASVFPGSSGSPVMIYNHGHYTTREGTVIGNRIFFCGLVSKAFYRRIADKHNVVTHSPEQNRADSEMIDLGVVVKSSVVEETIMNFLNSKGLGD